MNFDPLRVGDLVVVHVFRIQDDPPQVCSGQVMHIQKRWLRQPLYHVYLFGHQRTYKFTSKEIRKS